MVSNIDLLRNNTDSDPGDNIKSQPSDAQNLNKSNESARREETKAHEGRALSEKSSDDGKKNQGSREVATVKANAPEEPAMSGLLTRIIDHIETTDRRNSDALDAINNRLDSLAQQVDEKKEEKRDENDNKINDIQDKVSGLSRQVNDAKQASPSISPRTVFEERLSALTSKIDDNGSDNASAKERNSIESVSPEAQGNKGSAFGSNGKKAKSAGSDFRNADIVYKVTNTPAEPTVGPSSKSLNDRLADTREAIAIDELAQSFDDEITAAGLGHSEEQKANSAEANVKLQNFDNSADAFEALSVGYVDETAEQSNLTYQENNLGLNATTDLLTASQAAHASSPSPTLPDIKTDAVAATLQKAEEIGPRLDQLVVRFEDILNARNTEPLLKAIEEQIAELPQYLNREDNRQQRIDQIETNIASLTAMIQNTNVAIAELSEKIAEETATHVVTKLDWGPSADRLAAIDEYLRNLKEEEDLKQAETSGALAGVYDALEKMIGRLEAIEPPSEINNTLSADRHIEEYVTALPKDDANFIQDDNIDSIVDEIDEHPDFAPSNETPEYGRQSQSLSDHHSKFDSLDDSLQSAKHAATSANSDDETHSKDAYLSEASQRDEDDIRAGDEYISAAKRAARSAAQIDGRWDQHIPPYIAAKRDGADKPGSMNWIKQHKTGLIAASMVLVSAAAGLMLSQLPLFSGGTGESDRTASISEYDPTQTAAINRRQDGTVNGLRNGGLDQNTGVPALRGDSQSDYAENSGSQNLQRYPNRIDTTATAPASSQLRQPMQAPQTTAKKALDVPPGVAIGHVSEKSIRQQLHQSVRQQQLAELSKQTPHGATSSFPQGEPFNAATNQQQNQVTPIGNTDQGITRQAALNPAQQNTSAARRELPPPQIGPMSLRVSAAEGEAAAEYEVGSRYARGLGVEQNLAEAAKWFERSASRGYAPAQYRLATQFERGAGVEKDIERAKVWYTRSAQTGNIKAMHNLAVLHTGRSGEKPNYVVASQWFKKAAEHGLADSQYNLAILYENGLGMPKNLTEAYKWLTLAALSGDKEAGKRRDSLRDQLEQSAVTAAERAALQWKKQPAAKGANVENPRAKTFSKAATPQTTNRLATATAPSVIPTPARAPQTQLAPNLTTSTAVSAEPQKDPDPLVRKAQLLLSKLGYDTGPADGQVGPKTREAIVAFERRAGMPITGDVSLELLKRLASLSI